MDGTCCELFVKVFTLQSIPQEQALSVISSFVDHALVDDSEWCKLHLDHGYKGYTFSSLYRPEKSGTYRKENIYQILIRTENHKLAQYLADTLPKQETTYLKGLVSNIRMVPQRHITTLYTLTPVIVKGQNGGYWRDSMTFDEFGQRLKDNLVKKYKAIRQEDLQEDFMFWNLLEITNRSPIAVPYKGIKLLGDKVQIQVSDHPSAQKLAYIALGAGAGEMNSRGMGYVNCHFI